MNTLALPDYRVPAWFFIIALLLRPLRFFCPPGIVLPRRARGCMAPLPVVAASAGADSIKIILGKYMSGMKRTILAGAWMMLVAGVAQAAPINYTFTGVSVGEFSGAGAPVFGSTIYSGSTQVSGSFAYDSEVAAVGAVPVPGYNNAPFAAYQGAFSNINMNLAGASVTADSGAGLVGDNVSPTGTSLVLDVLLGFSSSADPLANLSPLQVGNWNLTSFSFVLFNAPGTYWGSDLPAELGALSHLMEFFFEDTQGQVQKVRYALSGVEQVVSVPEPSTLVLLALGLSGLLLRRRQG